MITWLLAMWSFITPVQAQDSTVSVSNYDPIAATLDSLLNQNFIQRLSSNAANGADFNSSEVPSYADDIYRKRIEKLQTPIPLVFNEEVKQYIEMYGIRKRALTERVMGLSQLYFPLFEQVLDQQGLPEEFKYLSIVESALNPVAVSPVGATGLWQFMLSTGKLYGLQVNSLIDERRDPVRATYAACQYFKDMYAIYNDWLLVVASYNCGAGNVNRAIARSGGKRTFWEISPYLPRETRGYVPAFIAVTYLMNYTGEHNLSAVAPLVNYFDVDTVHVNHRLDLRQVAQAVNVPFDILSYLNPVYKKGVIPNSEQPQALRLPVNKMNAYLAVEDDFLIPVIEQEFQDEANTDFVFVNDLVRKSHKVRRGEQLQVIARKYHCSVNDLKKWNHLRSTKLTAGKSLTVYVNVPKKVNAKKPAVAQQPAVQTVVSATTDSVVSDSVCATQEKVSSPMTIQTVKDNGEIYHVVAPGDTLWNIAQRYQGLTVDKIKEINRLNSNELKVGTRLKVAVGG